MSRGGEKLAGRFFQQSSWATHTLALEHQLVKVPDGLDSDLTGPYGCSISTGAGAVLNELKPYPGSSIAIFGAGNVGLRRWSWRLELTGATTITSRSTKFPSVWPWPRNSEPPTRFGAWLGASSAELKELTEDHLDFSIESTDGSNLVSEAIEALGIRGTCAMVGGAKMTATVKYNHPDVLLKGKRIIGVMGGGGQTPMFLESLMELQRGGRFPLQKLVKFYDFEDINQAIDDSDNHEAIKPIVRMR